MTQALVTGAARGLGLEVARLLAREGVGVVIAARSGERAVEAARGLDGVEALEADLDLADPEAIAAAVTGFGERFGTLDVLVNNAAAHPDLDETVTTADLDHCPAALQATLLGTWRILQATLPLLRASEHPRIVNVSSGSGAHDDDRVGLSAAHGTMAGHAIAKAGVNALTAALAAELADTAVMVNAVCPGFTATQPGLESMGARPAADSAVGVVWAATLPDDGPRGGFFRDGERIGW